MRDLDSLAMGFLVSFKLDPNATDGQKDKAIKAAYAWGERFEAHVRARDKKLREKEDAKRTAQERGDNCPACSHPPDYHSHDGHGVCRNHEACGCPGYDIAKSRLARSLA